MTLTSIILHFINPAASPFPPQTSATTPPKPWNIPSRTDITSTAHPEQHPQSFYESSISTSNQTSASIPQMAISSSHSTCTSAVSASKAKTLQHGLHPKLPRSKILCVDVTKTWLSSSKKPMRKAKVASSKSMANSSSIPRPLRRFSLPR